MEEEALVEDSNSQNAKLTLVSITKQAGQHNKRKLTFSDKTAIIILNDIIRDHALYRGQIIKVRTKQELLSQSVRLEIQKKTLLFLSQRPHSYYQLEKKLEKKGFEQHDISYVLDNLAELGYLDDREFARLWIDSRIKRRHEGRFSLCAGLMRTGVTRKIAEEIVALYSEQEEYGNLLKLLEKIRMSRHDTPEKLIRRLKTRGFPVNLILKALKHKNIIS
ncbi:MAG: RecX family transcriptional regulator [Spirochaetales bacterium]|nr:RecX family transcriptional regulator [Spirochaetales bacterium]